MTVASPFFGCTIAKATSWQTIGSRQKSACVRIVGRIVCSERTFSSSWYRSLKTLVFQTYGRISDRNYLSKREIALCVGRV